MTRTISFSIAVGSAICLAFVLGRGIRGPSTTTSVGGFYQMLLNGQPSFIESVSGRREEMQKAVVQVLDDAEISADVKLRAVEIARIEKIDGACHWLVGHIDFGIKPGRAISLTTELAELYPCIATLLSIGKPASIELCSEIVEETRRGDGVDLKKVDLYTATLKNIESHAGAISLLRREAAKRNPTGPEMEAFDKQVIAKYFKKNSEKMDTSEILKSLFDRQNDRP